MLFSFSHFIIYLFVFLRVCFLSIFASSLFHRTTIFFNNKSHKSTITFWIHSESCWCLFALAVPAPTGLGFGQVGSDSMEVTWVSPHVPNTADINSFFVRYEQKPLNVLKGQYYLSLIQMLSWMNTDLMFPHCADIIPLTMKMTSQKPAWQTAVTKWCWGVSYSKNPKYVTTHRRTNCHICIHVFFAVHRLAA